MGIDVVVVFIGQGQFGWEMMELAMLGFGGTGGFAGMSGGGLGSMMSGMAFSPGRSMVSESLSRAVNFIVGPHAQPTQELVDFAMNRFGPPRDMQQFLQYIPIFQRIARSSYGPTLARMASPVTSATITGNAHNSTVSGRSLAQLYTDLDNMIFERSMQWLQQPEAPQAMDAGSRWATAWMMIPFMMGAF